MLDISQQQIADHLAKQASPIPCHAPCLMRVLLWVTPDHHHPERFLDPDRNGNGGGGPHGSSRQSNRLTAEPQVRSLHLNWENPEWGSLSHK